MIEEYILTTDGKDYVDVDCVREALGIVDEHVDIFGVIKKLREERDQLKEKCDKMKKRANAVYGVSCGYSGDKEPAFLCNVISYSWNFGLIAAHSLMDEPSYPIRNDSIRVELELTPTANYKGTFDLEDLKHYIQAYGREKKLGIVESVDYQNAKAARAELASLYKTVLGKEKLDRDLSPHEVMKAILDEYKRVRDSKVISAEYLRKEFQRFCKEYNVFPITDEISIHDWIQYIFNVLADYRTIANDNFNKAEGFRKEKRTVEDSLAELRAKVREIYRSVFCDCRWEVGYSHCSALNDINEEYKRVKDFFKEKNDELKEAKQSCKDYTELCKAIWEAMDRKPETLPEETARLVGEVRMLQLNDISLKWMHDEVAKAIGMDYPVTNNDIVNRVKSLCDANESSCDVISDLKRKVVELARGKKLLIEFRDDVAKAIGMDYPTTNQVILNNVQYIYKDREDAYNIVSKLNDQVTALSKAKEDLQQMLIASQKDAKGWTNRCISLADTHSEMQAFRRNAIDDLKTRGFCFRYEEDETLPEIFDKLLKSYDLVYGSYKEQYRLRQMWHVRWESEHERANGEHKRAEKLRKEVTALTNRIEFLKISNASQANSIVASQAFKNECRKLKEEKAKVIAALGQDIWDDCVK